MTDLYAEEFLKPLKRCLEYKPAFGTASGVTDIQFLERYSDDFFYNAVGLANRELYIAHKAAGGMTSFYRQLGVACEVLTRSVLMKELNVAHDKVRWDYTLPTGTARERLLTLDARLAPTDIPDPIRRKVVQRWLIDAATNSDIAPAIAKDLLGAVFEVRQGYKSADSKRQNADLGFGIHAIKAGYLPCLLVFSSQVSEVVVRRYKQQGLYIILGSSSAQGHMDTRHFFRDVVGWDFAGWLDEQGPMIRAELANIIRYLLT